GSTVSRYLTRRTSSMRAPLSAIEPTSSGVSKVTRGERASASVRLTICAGCAARRLRGRAVLGRCRLLLIDRRLGRREGVLPAHDDQHREHDSDNEILLVHCGRTLGAPSGALDGLAGKRSAGGR